MTNFSSYSILLENTIDKCRLDRKWNLHPSVGIIYQASAFGLGLINRDGSRNFLSWFLGQDKTRNAVLSCLVLNFSVSKYSWIENFWALKILTCLEVHLLCLIVSNLFLVLNKKSRVLSRLDKILSRPIRQRMQN